MRNTHGPYNILIVEDNDTMREGILRVVQKMKQGASEVSSGEEAQAALGKSKFDLVITDYKLPGMTGLEVLNKAKTQAPSTEVMMITAYGTQIQRVALIPSIRVDIQATNLCFKSRMPAKAR